MRANRLWQPLADGKSGVKNRFRILPFTNPRTGTDSWRVTGSKRDGTRIRENFSDQAAAQARRVELETEFLGQQTDTSLRATKLTETQLRLAEVAFVKLDNEGELLLAIEYWNNHGRQLSVKNSVRLDEAAAQFKAWLETTSSLREDSKIGLRIRINTFVNSVANVMLSAITPEFIENYLAKSRGDLSGITRDNDRRAISRFFSWCIERPRRWIATNPAHEVKVDRGEILPPSTLTVDDCEKLFRAAETHKAGIVLPYVAVCLIAGLRPEEAKRLTWQQVNLADKEIRLEANQTKTKAPRVIAIHPALEAWLTAHKDKSFCPANWRREFDAVKEKAGFTGRQVPDTKAQAVGKPFPHDVMRHTAISHFFRDCGSYGLTAEQFGNSEAIIKKHYQGRVSKAETIKFYSIQPMVTP